VSLEPCIRLYSSSLKRKLRPYVSDCTAVR